MDQLLLGSGLTLVVSLIAAAVGARFQAAREHRLWVREKRYEHITRVLRVATREDWNRTHGASIREAQSAAERLVVPTRRGMTRRSRRADDVAKVDRAVGNLDTLEPRYIELLEAVRELDIVGPRNLARLGTELVLSVDKPRTGDTSPFIYALDAFQAAARKVLETDV